MDEFLQGINASIYLKWILMQNNHYSLNIKVDDNDNNTIIISNEIVIGKIIYYGKGIFEEELNDRQTKEKIFYLHSLTSLSIKLLSIFYHNYVSIYSFKPIFIGIS